MPAKPKKICENRVLIICWKHFLISAIPKIEIGVKSILVGKTTILSSLVDLSVLPVGLERRGKKLSYLYVR